MEVDFPRRKKQSPEMAAVNQKLASQHGVEGFPLLAAYPSPAASAQSSPMMNMGEMTKDKDMTRQMAKDPAMARMCDEMMKNPESMKTMCRETAKNEKMKSMCMSIMKSS